MVSLTSDRSLSCSTPIIHLMSFDDDDEDNEDNDDDEDNEDNEDSGIVMIIGL